MIETMKESGEVLYATNNVVSILGSDLLELRKLAELNPRRRIRLCCHRGVDDVIHEMVIYHPRGTYVQPHMHEDKDESFHLILGQADIVFFNQHGKVIEVLPMGAHGSGKAFYYRIPPRVYHTQIFREDTFFHEVTRGPFNAESTIKAKWAPVETEVATVVTYMNEILKTVTSLGVD